MITAKARCHAVGTLLSVLTRKAGGIKRAYKPIRWFVECKCCQIRLELVIPTAAISRRLRPPFPLFLSGSFVKAFVESPYLTVMPIVVATGEVGCDVRRS
jgi:hypothetical protein